MESPNSAFEGEPFDEEALRNLLKQKYANAKAHSRETFLELHNRITAFARQLKARYGDSVDQYRAYHVLIGSSEPRDKFDFEEKENSIEEFLRNL